MDLWPGVKAGDWPVYFGKSDSDWTNCTYTFKSNNNGNGFDSRLGNQEKNSYCSFTVDSNYNVVFDKNGITINNTLYSWNSTPVLSPDNHTLWIAAENNNNTGGHWDRHRASIAKFGEIRVWENNVLIGDFKPAVDNNSNVGFYDEVSQLFKANLGTGTPVAGPILSSINVFPSKTVLAATGETISISVSCDNAWEVSGNTWLTLSSTGDTSGTTITATAPSYSGASVRTDTLTFTDFVTGDEIEITIKQKKYTNGQPFYLGADEITEIYLGVDTITEAYLGDVLVFYSNAPAPTPTPTGGTRTISISSIPIPTLDGEGNAGGTDIYIEDENQNYASLSLAYSDPWDSSSYEENVDATQSFSATYASGYFEVEGEWGDDITINYSYTDSACAGVPEGYDVEQPTFVNGVISTSFPTPESDPECECYAAGGEWDSENQECTESDPCEGIGEEECECISNGGTWVTPEMGPPYCEQGGDVDCEGDPECLCTQCGGVWTHNDMTDEYYCDCNADPECECISAGGTWDGTDCTYPEPEDPEY